MEPANALNPDRVQQLMIEREINRRELCADVGISESYLSRILNRRTRVTKSSLIERVAEVLAVEPESLVQRPEAPPVRVAVPPHLWSAPFLNHSRSNGSEGQGFEILEGDQAFTGGDALAALRRGTADLALAFETPLDMTDDSDVAILGSICAGNDYVRLLIRRTSPLARDLHHFDDKDSLKMTERDEGAQDKPSVEPTAVTRGETVAIEYLRQLEGLMPSLDRVHLADPDPARPWLDREGRPVHLVLIWEPMASAMVAASGDELVDVFDELEGRLPTNWYPRAAEYQLLVSQARLLPKERLRQMIKDLQTAVLELNHYVSKSRLVLQSQPVIDCLIETLPFELDATDRARLRQLLARRLGQVKFRLRLRPEVVTAGLL